MSEVDTNQPRQPLPKVPPEFDRLLTRVGYINYAWTNTESLLIHLLSGLAPTDAETATIIHLTLNTTKARLDLIERLAKREKSPLPPDALKRILHLTRGMRKVSGVRNQVNHALYAFDAEAGTMRSIQMKIADRKSGIKYGADKTLDADSVAELDQTLVDIRQINAEIWKIISDYKMLE